MARISSPVLARLRRATAKVFHGRGAIANTKTNFDLAMQALEDEYESRAKNTLRSAINAAVGGPTFNRIQEDNIITAWMAEKSAGNI